MVVSREFNLVIAIDAENILYDISLTSDIDTVARHTEIHLIAIIGNDLHLKAVEDGLKSLLRDDLADE